MRLALFAAAISTTLSCHGGPGTEPRPFASHSTAQEEYNEVVLYLKGAELQVETQEQGGEVRRAMLDMLTLSSQELCARRYADYRLEPNKWTIGTLLRHYVVPSPLQTIHDEARFCREAASPEAKIVIREYIRAIDEHRQPVF